MTSRQDEIADLYAERAALIGLLEHPGWKALCASALAERELILRVFEAPLVSMDEAPAQEYSKGRAYQLRMLPGAPQALIDNLTVEIESIPQEPTHDRDLADRIDRTDSERPVSDGAERAP